MPGNADLRIRVTEEGNVKIVEMSGDVDSYSTDALRRNIRPLCDAAKPWILIDCFDVGYVNSACLGRFHDFHKLCAEKGGRLVFCNVDSSVRQVMDLLGLSQILNLAGSREDALAQLSALSAGADG
jgi:anti-sigma B factor antagonist